MIFSLRILSRRVIPSNRRWNLWCAASNFFFSVTVRGQSSALYSNVDITNDSYNFTLTGKLIYLFFQTAFSLPKISAPVNEYFVGLLVYNVISIYADQRSCVNNQN